MAELQIENSHLESFQFDEPKDQDRVEKAVLATFPAALASLSFGYCLGYSSSALEDLQNDNTSFSISLTAEQASWFSVSLIFLSRWIEETLIFCKLSRWISQICPSLNIKNASPYSNSVQVQTRQGYEYHLTIIWCCNLKDRYSVFHVFAAHGH